MSEDVALFFIFLLIYSELSKIGKNKKSGLGVRPPCVFKSFFQRTAAAFLMFASRSIKVLSFFATCTL